MQVSLGRYRVLKHLTSGGMADVLLGRSDGIEGFERHVVLKRIRAEHARDRRFISMFIDEARLAAGLHHQNIVQVFDIGEARGEYFFAMEYIHGEDLRKLLAAVYRTRGYVPLAVVCAIMSAVAAGLHYAHERRDSKGKPLDIVHRDVSPSNVIVGYDGAVKIVDFGIAKTTVRRSETVAGSLKGKCSYMSPEQCKGEPIDRRSDVYGLGVLLYELATTTRLFKADNEYLVMDAIVNGRFALPQVRRPDLPNELSSIIMRALDRDPARRFQTADELRVELDQFAAAHDLKSSTATLASYMKKIFGERVEPWLDLAAEPELAGISWSDTASGGARDSRRRLRGIASIGDAPRSVPAIETGPTLRLGVAALPSLQGSRSGSKWLIAAALPLVAFAGIGVWKLAGDADSTQHLAAHAPSASSPGVTAPPAPIAPRVVGAPTVTPIDTAGVVPSETAATVAAAAPMPPIVPPPAEALREAVKKAHAKKADARPERVTAAVVEAPAAPAPALAVAPKLAPSPAPVAAKPEPLPAAAAAIATAAPVPAPAAAEPKPVEAAPIPTLSNATVAATASDHAAQLATCEGGAKLNGDVAVSFQIDGNGKVVRSQLSSTIKNAKVAACILRAVTSWKFARPPSGAARGVYSISYQ